MSSDVQVDSSSSSSSFIASGCSSPATLRRSVSRGGGGGGSATRSLPMAKRKPLLAGCAPPESAMASGCDRHRQPNRSISLQETHSGVGLEEVKEAVDENEDGSTKSAGSASLNVAGAAMPLPESASAADSGYQHDLVDASGKSDDAVRPCKRGPYLSYDQIFLCGVMLT